MNKTFAALMAMAFILGAILTENYMLTTMKVSGSEGAYTVTVFGFDTNK